MKKATSNMGNDPCSDSPRSKYIALIDKYPWLVENMAGGFEIVTTTAAMDEAERSAWERFQVQRTSDQALADATPSASSDWFRVGVVFEDSFLIVVRDAVRTPENKLTTYLRIYNRLEKGPGAAVLARLDDKVVLLRHHRHALRCFLVEVPRGFSKPSETCEDTARRQIKEEIDGVCKSYTNLGTIHPDAGKIGDSVCGMLIELESVGKPERGEAISGYELVGEKELTRRIAVGEITDAFTLSLYAKAVAKGLLRPR